MVVPARNSRTAAARPGRAQRPAAVSRREFRKVRKTRVSEEIIEQVRDLITSGRLNPGDRLPAERELAETFAVSRSVVREAIRALETLGVLEARPGEGTFVASSLSERANDPISSSLYQAWSMQRKLFEVREVIEPDLAALAARRATAEHIEKMRAILAEQEAQIRQGGTGVRQDTLFHYLLAEATGNEILLRIMDSLMDLLLKTREESLQHDKRPARSLKQHRAMLRAIEARNPRAAERLMYQHIAEIEELVFSQGKQPLAEPATPPSAPDPEIRP